jgi:hypothetical protein
MGKAAARGAGRTHHSFCAPGLRNYRIFIGCIADWPATPAASHFGTRPESGDSLAGTVHEAPQVTIHAPMVKELF